MASPLDLYSFVSGEYDAGRKQRDGNRLKALYQQALSDFETLFDVTTKILKMRIKNVALHPPSFASRAS